MDLRNVVFIEDKSSSGKNKTKGNKKRRNGRGVKAKKVPIEGRVAKHNRPRKQTGDRVDRVALISEKKSKMTKPSKEKEKLSQHWNKIPPGKGEPNTKKQNKKEYHWCPHCNYWSLHKPGKGKHCQAVDPLAHLLNYFGGTALSQPKPQSQDVPPLEFMDWDDVSL